MKLLRTGPLVFGLAAGLAAGLSSGQMTSTIRPAAGGPAPVTVTPVPPAPVTAPAPAAPAARPQRGSAAGSVDDTQGAPTAAGAGSAVMPTAPGLPPTPQAIAASFLTADADRDGMLTRAEAQQLTVMPPGLTFEDMDRDKDGRLSRSEYEAGMGR